MQAEWGQILFTDEKRFCVQENDCRSRIYQERVETLYDNCVIERDRHDGGSVMIWAYVSLHQKTKIVFINENLTAAHYQNEEFHSEC